MRPTGDRKSTRLNSSHGYISYAVFCLKKKNTHTSSIPVKGVNKEKLSISLSPRFFFFNVPATTEIYTLSLHDALPISLTIAGLASETACLMAGRAAATGTFERDRKSTRLNSSHGYISYAVFCLKK